MILIFHIYVEAYYYNFNELSIYPILKNQIESTIC